MQTLQVSTLGDPTLMIPKNVRRSYTVHHDETTWTQHKKTPMSQEAQPQLAGAL